ncbi:MAG: hypothetical protein AAGA99_26560 [Actinomycetota bacterium]
MTEPRRPNAGTVLFIADQLAKGIIPGGCVDALRTVAEDLGQLRADRAEPDPSAVDDEPTRFQGWDQLAERKRVDELFERTDQLLEAGERLDAWLGRHWDRIERHADRLEAIERSMAKYDESLGMAHSHIGGTRRLIPKDLIERLNHLERDARVDPRNPTQIRTIVEQVLADALDEATKALAQ